MADSSEGKIVDDAVEFDASRADQNQSLCQP
jgi:hypothetical protein